MAKHVDSASRILDDSCAAFQAAVVMLHVGHKGRTLQLPRDAATLGHVQSVTEYASDQVLQRGIY